MSIIHDEVDIEEFRYNPEKDIYTYPCPCGDEFFISKKELLDGDDIATCPSCSLIVRVIYDIDVLRCSEQETTIKVEKNVKQRTSSK